MELLSCELLAIPAAAAAVILLNVHRNTAMSEISQGRQGLVLHVLYIVKYDSFSNLGKFKLKINTVLKLKGN
jgi:hypothetical protein